MTPERFAQIDRLFAEAAALAPGEREAYLDAQCGAEAELRAEVESLLAADAAAGARLAGTIEQAAAALPPNPCGADAGLRLGPYLLVRELGRGGMGAVYQAIRSDGEFLQTVAIKLVKRGMDSDAIVHRFRTERQILAGLSHPNIAALLDGGTTPDGRPYLVMEFIEGQPLIEFADSRGLDVRARLDLFRPLCRAIDYAHRHHVLHRDLKPANVMVTAEGVPKLLDFGIAKLLLPELVAGGAPATETHARLMTPDYASPEQIRGEELTPATDIYSLGVLLYRLLAGRQPYSVTGRSMAEMERAITEQTAPPPSQAAADPKVRSMLAGDLDTIIAMAMRKEPERRYATAADLDADLHRYLSGRPVEARRDSPLYRARRWTRRHGLAAAASASVVVLGSLAAGQYGLRRAGQVPPEALELCRRAEQLLRTDIRATQPGQGLPGPLRESIELWRRATQAAPRHVPAWTGLAGAAEFALDYDATNKADLERTAEFAAAQALQIDPQNAPAYSVRGALHYRNWRFADAVEEFRRSITIDPDQPYVVADLADCLRLTGRPQEAVDTLERAYRSTERGQASHGVNVRAHVVLLNALAGLYRSQDRFDLALVHARRAVQLQGNYAPVRITLGMILERQGDLAGAEREYLAAFAMRPGDQRTSAALGHLYAIQHRRKEAQEKLATLEALRAEGAPVDGSLALVYAGLGQPGRALQALESAVRAREAGVPFRFLDPRMLAIVSSPRGRDLAREVGIVPLS
jgi:serine/threonine protein kinase/Flp pilus assembly protein TadD